MQIATRAVRAETPSRPEALRPEAICQGQITLFNRSCGEDSYLLLWSHPAVADDRSVQIYLLRGTHMSRNRPQNSACKLVDFVAYINRPEQVRLVCSERP